MRTPAKDTAISNFRTVTYKYDSTTSALTQERFSDGVRREDIYRTNNGFPDAVNVYRNGASGPACCRQYVYDETGWHVTSVVTLEL